MIGNDIVDIKASEFSSKQRFKRYAAKVCTAKELGQLGLFEEPQQTLWRFWSIKEAAYKAGLRLAVCNSFSPYKIKVELLDEFCAEVLIDTTKFIARSIVNCDYVYSEVVLVDSGLSLVRNIVDIRCSSEIKKMVFKENKLPFFNADGGMAKIASVSHHGRFYALLHQSA